MRGFIAFPKVFGVRPGISFSLRQPAPAWGYARQRSQTGGFVYVIEREDNGHVKVGSSASPPDRRDQLQTGSSTRLHIVHTAFAGGAAATVERTAHDFLDRRRLIGEWFDVAPETAVAAVYAAAGRLGVTLNEPGDYDEAEAFELELLRRQRRFKRIRWTVFTVCMIGLFAGIRYLSPA